MTIPLDQESSTWANLMHFFVRTRCERNWLALVARPWHSPLWHLKKIVELVESSHCMPTRSHSVPR
eukprot:11759130-Prorocentrum_lima.AAC.1